MKFQKIILPVVCILAAIVAIFFLAPLKDWVEYKKMEEDRYKSIFFITAPAPGGYSYPRYCSQWWADKFESLFHKKEDDRLYYAGTLNGLTVTP